MTVQLELKAIKRAWLDDAMRQFSVMVYGLRQFTFDDFHRMLPEPGHVNWWGILAAKLKNQGLIRRVNAVPSKRPEANGRLISVWEATQ